ncbi:MAG: SDR family NAD(P)-dependent oxidoreductase [Alkalispirochaeta sp.]
MGRDSTILPWSSYWITGGSSGIGAALARELAAPSITLYLSGRSPQRLDAVAQECRQRGASVHTIPFDMADSTARAHAVAEVLAGNPPPEALINNAGLSQRSTAAETDFAVDRTLMEVDFLGAVEITKALLPSMLERGSGCIVAVSSVAALAPVPLRSSYNAAKAAQLAFFGTLANELARTPVSVHVAIPGFVKTAVSHNALTGTGVASGVMDPHQSAGIDGKTAARDILQGIATGRMRIYTGLTPKLRVMIFLARRVPGLLDRILQHAEVR